MSVHDHDVVAEIVRRIKAALPDVLNKVVHRIQTEIPFYATKDSVTADDLRTSVSNNIDYIIGNLTGTHEVDLSAPQATGRRRAAQRAPLVEMLTAYRIGFAEIWSALIVAARTSPPLSEHFVVDLAAAIFMLQNAYSDAAIAAYRDESQHILRVKERERAVLVEAILTGATAPGTLWEVAHALRLPLDGAFLVVAARTQLGHDPLPRAESRLAVLDVNSVWRLEADQSLGVLSLPNRARSDTVLDILGRHATTRVGVSPVFSELRQATWALRLARLALERSPQDSGVEQFRYSPLNALVAAAPAAALEAARTVLGGVLDLPSEERDLLLRTFDAWVDAGGSPQAASAALFCHPNTVRYRLHRIEACTGRTLKDPSDVAELVTAARAWAQLPHAEQN